MNITYRKATINDAYGIEFVAAHSWKETYTGLLPDDYLNYRINNIENRIGRTKMFLENHPDYLVCLVDDKVVGICEYEKGEEEYKDFGKIGALYVLKDYQGLGIGKTLFKLALEGLIDMGFDKMYLECMKGNNTINFYTKYTGYIKETIDYPINYVGNVKADIVLFDDIRKIYINLNNKNNFIKK